MKRGRVVKMNTKIETVGVRFDAAKIAAAVIVAVVGVAGFYYFADQPIALRVLGLLGCFAVAAVLFLMTEQGRTLWGFLQEAQVEVRKVVWPTKQETLQTTGIVILVVIIFAAVLWLLDMFLGWAVRGIIGQ
jgi:preprotein translocase subunit SecE